MNKKVVYRIKIMNCTYKVMGNTFQRFRKIEPHKDVSGSLITFDMSGIEFVSTEEQKMDVSGVQVAIETLEPIEIPNTVVTVVPIMPMLDAPLSITPLIETRLLPACEDIDTRRSAIFNALIAEIYGAVMIGQESRSKEQEEVNICSHVCRRLLQLMNPIELSAKTEELDSAPSDKNTPRATNTIRWNILDAANQAGKCKTV